MSKIANIAKKGADTVFLCETFWEQQFEPNILFPIRLFRLVSTTSGYDLRNSVRQYLWPNVSIFTRPLY